MDVMMGEATLLIKDLILLLLKLIVVIFSIGISYSISKVIAKTIIDRVYEALKINQILEKHKLKDALFGISVKSIATLWLVIYLFLIILISINSVLSVATKGDLAFPKAFVDLIDNFLGYMSNLGQGLILLVLFAHLADYLSDRIREREDLMFSLYLAAIVQGLLIILGLAISLPSIFPSTNVILIGELVKIILAGIMLAIALAVGIALGLGSHPFVSEYINQHYKDLKNKSKTKKEGEQK